MSFNSFIQFNNLIHVIQLHMKNDIFIAIHFHTVQQAPSVSDSGTPNLWTEEIISMIFVCNIQEALK